MFLAILLPVWNHIRLSRGTIVLLRRSSQVEELLPDDRARHDRPLYPDRRSAIDALLSD